MQQLFEAVSVATGGKLDKQTWDAGEFATPDGAPRFIDMGCGNTKIPGSIGVDIIAVPNVDIVADFTRGLPFKTNSIDGVYTSHTLEHTDNMLPVMEELWRICKPGAAVYARGPHATCPYSTWSDPTHKRGLTLETFRYFQEQHLCNFYTNARFKVVWGRLYVRLATLRESQWFGRRLFTNVLEGLANGGIGAQYRCERWWGPWVGIEEVHVLLRVVK